MNSLDDDLDRELPLALEDMDAEALSNVDQAIADSHQTEADLDQSSADLDQSSSDRDQVSSDRDQEAADHDQAISDRTQSQGDADEYAQSRRARSKSATERDHTSHARLETSQIRDEVATRRDQQAKLRDEAAQARDRIAAALDAELERLELEGPRENGGQQTGLNSSCAIASAPLTVEPERQHSARRRLAIARKQQKTASMRRSTEQPRHRGWPRREPTTSRQHWVAGSGWPLSSGRWPAPAAPASGSWSHSWMSTG